MRKKFAQKLFKKFQMLGAGNAAREPYRAYGECDAGSPQQRRWTFLTVSHGFTLIETLVAISLLVVAIAAPMSLAAQSLSSAFYARDQVTAFHLAQEAIEAVRSVRDRNLLISIAGTQTNFLDGVPNTAGQPFTIDTRDNSMVLCPNGICPVLRNDGNLYGYAITPGWKDTRFTRIVRVTMVGGSTYEAKIAVEVRWRSGAFQERNFTINENLYEWVSAGGL
jgi:prepilin-type N-terminal cleavage/methylation domain-containing protein